MRRIKLADLSTLEKSPTSPINLRNKIGEVLMNSVHAVAKAEVLNEETGEYRLILQGNLDLEEKSDEG